MPVTLTPATRSVLTRDAIRVSLRDIAGRIPNTGEINSMLDGVQFSDDEIDNAIGFTVDRYNGTPPMIGIVTADSINRYTLLVGVVCFLLTSESHRQVRNQATVQDGDVPQLGVDDKASLYSQLAQLACQEFKERMKESKIAANMDLAWGAIGSGYHGTGRNSRS